MECTKLLTINIYLLPIQYMCMKPAEMVPTKIQVPSFSGILLFKNLPALEKFCIIIEF